MQIQKQILCNLQHFRRIQIHVYTMHALNFSLALVILADLAPK